MSNVELRERLGLNQPIPKAAVRDGALYAFWAIVGLTWMVLTPVAVLIVVTLWLL